MRRNPRNSPRSRRNCAALREAAPARAATTDRAPGCAHARRSRANPGRREEIDIRLSELAKRVDARCARARSRSVAQSGPAERPRLDIRELLSQIARRQSDARRPRPAAGRLVPPRSPANGAMARSRALKPPRASGDGFRVATRPRDGFVGSRAVPEPSRASRPPRPTGPALETLRAEILSLKRRTRPHAGRGARRIERAPADRRATPRPCAPNSPR